MKALMKVLAVVAVAVMCAGYAYSQFKTETDTVLLKTVLQHLIG